MLIILEGLDKTGKSTVAEHFRKEKRFEYIHMTAPAKWHTRDSYYTEMLHLIASTAGKNVVIDRSWYGELVWPSIFCRTPLLSFSDVQDLSAIARIVHKDQLEAIYMYDPDRDAHLARIAKFKEPSYDFNFARSLYDNATYSFQRLTFQEAETKGWT